MSFLKGMAIKYILILFDRTFITVIEVILHFLHILFSLQNILDIHGHARMTSQQGLCNFVILNLSLL